LLNGLAYRVAAMTSDAAATPEAAAARLADRLGLPAPALVRRSMHAVYRAGPAILRFIDDEAGAEAQLRLLDLLRNAGVPVADAVDHTVHAVDGHFATVWRYVEHDVGASAPWEAVGAACAVIHGLDPSVVTSIVGPLPSPVDFPWLQLDETLAVLPAPEQVLLAPHWERIRAWRSDILEVEAVVCHGDLHPGNVLVGEHEWVLIDWDTLCRAPRAFDHAPLLTWGRRWGGAPDLYARFARGYGRDLSSDPLTNLLADARNLAATMMLCRRALDDPTRRDQAALRLRYWAGDPDAPTWTAQ